MIVTTGSQLKWSQVDQRHPQFNFNLINLDSNKDALTLFSKFQL